MSPRLFRLFSSFNHNTVTGPRVPLAGFATHRWRCQTGSRRKAAQSDDTGDHAKANGSQDVTFSYHSEGHYKATIEDAFAHYKPKRKDIGTQQGAPWHFGWQTNERNVVWSDSLRLRMLKVVAAKQGAISPDDIGTALDSLVSILPDIEPRLPSMKPEVLLRLASDVDTVAAKLLELRTLFPSANCGRMLAKELGLLNMAHDELSRRAAELRTLVPDADVDLLVQENAGSVLSITSFRRALEDAKRLLPAAEVQSRLDRDPSFVLSLQRGSDMIPYDAIPENPWGHQ